MAAFCAQQFLNGYTLAKYKALICVKLMSSGSHDRRRDTVYDAMQDTAFFKDNVIRIRSNSA